jgi:hypothetical protein
MQAPLALIFATWVSRQRMLCAAHDPYIYTAPDHRCRVRGPNPLLGHDNYPLSRLSDPSNGGGVQWGGAANVNPPRNRRNPPMAALSLKGPPYGGPQ